MSFILDALKKSEVERQRQSVPGLIDVPVATRRRGIPAWVWILAALLGVNVLVLSVLLLRSPDSAIERPAVGARPAGLADSNAQQDTGHFSPLDAAPVYAPEVPVAGGATASTTVPTTVSSNASPQPHGDAPARTAHRADPVLNDEPPDNEEMLPSLSELNLSGNQTLPDIHLDVHVYATRSADRFVYINMRKYREGNVLQEGPTLERIRRDGVVLSYNGLRFFVPRQS